MLNDIYNTLYFNLCIHIATYKISKVVVVSYERISLFGKGIKYTLNE